MILVRPTHRHVFAVIVLVWLLACGGLGWATHSAIQLDRIEDLGNLRRADEARMERALARVEAEIAPVLYPERARPYSHFRSYYITTEARYRGDASDASRDIVVASPLKDYRGPDWIMLHFQVSESEGWSSPELDEGAKFAMPAGAIPAGDRPREATPENWLAALKDRYTADSLQQMLEVTLMRSDTTAGAPRASAVNSSRSEPDNPALLPGAEPPAKTEATESARRAERLLQLQLESYPEFSCEPELVAMENLETRPPGFMQRSDTGACVNVYAPLMTPVWLDLTLDGRPQLALVRSTTVETSRYCTLQGVLIDWDRLRARLERQIKDIFPNGSLVPVLFDDANNAGALRGRLHTIPVRIEPGEAAPRAEASGLSSGLIGGLVVSWGATLLALLAVTYGVLKYLAISERRMRFVAAVTHELRTPLTSFQLYSDLLTEMREEDGEKRRRYSEALRGEASRLARLVENVLAYSRLQEDAPGVSPASIEPERILEETKSATAEMCRAAGKTLTIENHCLNGQVLETDPEFVLRILTNLVENSCKYGAGEEDPRIFLTASPGPGGGVAFDVDDGGPGIPPRDRRAVFEPFRRGRQESERRAGGVGLGLSLSRYWAHCLGGLLTLHRSKRNGTHYSCFSLTLPRAAPHTRDEPRA